MNEYTPTTDDVRSAYMESRNATCAIRGETSENEFDQWLTVHDQGIRDAVRPAEMTAKEHTQSAWDAAYEVPEGRKIPAHTPYIVRWTREMFSVNRAGFDTAFDADSSIRTLDPLPPVIPADCNLVMAGRRGDVRRPWTRHSNPSWHGTWFSVTSTGKAISTAESLLIDPKPVTKES